MVRRHLEAVLPAISRFALVLTRARSDADDLVQMTCERALSRSAQWQPDTRLESWLFRIMHSIWVNEIRARRVRLRHRDEAALSDHAQDGVRAEDSRVELLQVEEHVARLPEGHRVVLLLVCVEGLSYREAAEVLGVPIGTVMSRLARARLQLAGMLEAAAPSQTANIHRLRT